MAVSNCLRNITLSQYFNPLCYCAITYTNEVNRFKSFPFNNYIITQKILFVNRFFKNFLGYFYLKINAIYLRTPAPILWRMLSCKLHAYYYCPCRYYDYSRLSPRLNDLTIKAQSATTANWATQSNHT